MASAPPSQSSHVPLCEPSPIDNINPRLPRVGDRFDSWDDFRFWSRRAAEVRGFTLSQSQSKGSSGTIVLRCSRFKDPGTVGQKMAENGCEVVYKVMKAKNGQDGFEVVHSFDQHNHPFGPDIPTGHRPGTSLSGQAPKRKKIKTAPVESTNPVGPNYIPHTATPPSSQARPFVFDPYTGEKLPQPIEAPTGSTPSPPNQFDPIHQPPPPPPPPPSLPPVSASSSSSSNPTLSSNHPAHPHSLPRAPGSLNGTPRSHSSRGGVSRAATYPHPPSKAHHPPLEIRSGTLPTAVVSQQQQQFKNHSTPPMNHHHHHYQPTRDDHHHHLGGFHPTNNYPPLSVKFSSKAQNSITEFLMSLSPALAPYGTHFRWVGIQSPSDLLELVRSSGEDELELFLDELDTCGIGGRGEGVSQEEKILIVSGLRKLSSIKSSKS